MHYLFIFGGKTRRKSVEVNSRVAEYRWEKDKYPVIQGTVVRERESFLFLFVSLSGAHREESPVSGQLHATYGLCCAMGFFYLIKIESDMKFKQKKTKKYEYTTNFFS